MFTIKEVAKKIGLSEMSIYRLVSADEIPYIRVGPMGKTIRFIEEDISKWMELRKGGYRSIGENKEN